MTPTLEELLNRLKSLNKEELEILESVFVLVAAGLSHPTNPPLPPNVVLFACQAMCVLINHVDQENSPLNN